MIKDSPSVYLSLVSDSLHAFFHCQYGMGMGLGTRLFTVVPNLLYSLPRAGGGFAAIIISLPVQAIPRSRRQKLLSISVN